MALLAQPAFAQQMSCQAPVTVTAPPIAVADGPVRILPITSYVLALTWAPDFCDTHPDTGLECKGHAARFGFVLHGLWPDADNGTWPQWCPAKAPATLQVPAAVTRAMLCTTPSPTLIAHEWAKHGTCMAPSPKSYFAQSSGLFHALHFPDMAALARRSHLTVGDLREAFADANPRYPRASVGVMVGDGVSLQELHLCLDRYLHPAACPVPGIADSAPLRIVR
jgi:ribonuclease T2